MIGPLFALLLSSSVVSQPAASSSAPSSSLIKDGDRVVFLGDSITAIHTWTRYVEEAVRLRAPQLSVTFINAGVGGNTAEDALARLDVDVLGHKPHVVFLNFGMNDASYPDGSTGAAWEANMATLIDRLKKSGVRTLVWIDPSPYDASGLGAGHKNTLRAHRLEEMAAYVEKTGREQGLVTVSWNAPLQAALKTWKVPPHADKDAKLLPDRIHPGPPAHAIMGLQAAKAVGVDVGASVVAGELKGGALAFSSPAALPSPSWDGATPLTFDLQAATAPLLFSVTAKEAADLGNVDVQNARKLLLQLKGLPKDKKYEVKAGDSVVGVFAGKDLAAGVDLMGALVDRLPPPKDGRPSLAECTSTTGNPWQNDFYCLFDLLFEKDQLRIHMRYEKTRALPDFVPGRYEALLQLERDWVVDVDREIERRARALRKAPHLVTLTPQP